MPRRVRSIFSLDETPIAWRPAKNTTAMRMRAEMEAQWQAGLGEYQERSRTPEAVCRGYDGRDPDPPWADDDASTPVSAPFAEGDDLLAAREWLHQNLVHLPYLSGLLELPFPHAPRATGRAGMAAMLGQPSGQIRSPRYYLCQCVRSLMAGRLQDPRTWPRYFASSTWPDSLRQFALVADRRTSREGP